MRNRFYLIVFALFIGLTGGVQAQAYDDFFIALRNDNVAVVKALLDRGFDPNTPNPQTHTPLYLAIRDNAPKVTELLLAHPKIDVNRLNRVGESALMMAALRGNLAVAQRLLEKDADAYKVGWAPLHYAATNGDLAMIRLLLEHHAYIDAEAPTGQTPLMMAARFGTPAAVKLLLEEGADPLIKTKEGFTALDFARFGNKPESAELIGAFVRAKQPRGVW